MSSGDVEPTNVKVMVRCRPFVPRELSCVEGGVDVIRSIVAMDGTTVRVMDPERNYGEREAFEFDNALWSIPESQNQYTTNDIIDQEEVFDLTGRPAVANALAGYHNTIFAYGQTGSGKTHTMLGTEEEEGIAPRLVKHLFEKVEQAKADNPHERMQFSIELSFMEIYNERVKDLLAIAQRGKGLSNATNTEYAECRVRFHPERGTYVEGLMRMSITSEEQCLVAIRAGMEHRATTSTLMNDTSSRSHAIFQICLSQKSPLKGTTRVSIINLVDLAGSERIKMSGVTGQALTEAKNINLSLSTLRRVIDVLIDNSKLKKGQRPAIPPYRESLLTWVLSDSLGGNSKTVMIAAVSPYSGNIEDTLGTLRYALKAKAIVCNARVNEEKTAAVVNALRNEMEELRRQLEAKADADQVEQQRLEDELKEREDEFTSMQDESKRLDDLKKKYEDELQQKHDELERAQLQMDALQNVEEEKVRKEEELLKAREMQYETALLLQKQEEERKKKDAELAHVISRKNSLKRHHDKAAEEEAKARLAAEQARLRQFASAFQNAFLLKKQKTGLDELREEHIFISDRVETLRSDLAQREAQLNEMITDKSLLQRKVDLLDKRCQSMQSDLRDVLEAKNHKIDELSEHKKAAVNDLFKAQTELSFRREELQKLRSMFDAEQEDANKKLGALEDEQARVENEIEAKEERLAQLKVVLRDTKAKLDTLDASATQYQEKISKLRLDNAQKADTLAELQKRKAMLTQQREEARVLLEKRQQQLEATRGNLEEVSTQATLLKEHHADLREFVSHKFFPVGNMNSAASNKPNSGGDGSGTARGERSVSPDAKLGSRSPSTAKQPAFGRGPSVGSTPSQSRGRTSASLQRSPSHSLQQTAGSPSVRSTAGLHDAKGGVWYAARPRHVNPSSLSPPSASKSKPTSVAPKRATSPKRTTAILTPAKK